MTDKFEVSALVVSYNPDCDKLLMTIRSLLLQKDVFLQIVVADDGSECDCFAAIEEFLSKEGFRDYSLVKNPENQGTVMNFLSGLRRCGGSYVKPISPGDYLMEENALREWIDYAERNNAVVCGSDYVCYYDEPGGGMVATKQRIHPRSAGLSGSKLRLDYLINEDLFLGAATLCDGMTLQRYATMLEGKVKYAEDNCYRLMAFCGENMIHFEKEMVLYEVGTGVSTKGNDKWKSLLRKDWSVTDSIMMNMETRDEEIEKAFRAYMTAKDLNWSLRRLWLKWLSQRGTALLKLKAKLKPRISSGTLPVDWIRRIGGICS